VSDLPGKNAGQQVMAQGKQLQAVTQLLAEKGVPKKWMTVEDLTSKKK
jgi:translation initiation factor 2D